VQCRLTAVVTTALRLLQLLRQLQLPAPAPAPAPEMTSVAEQEAQIEKAGETAAARARRLGLASTIATSPGGLLAGGEGTTRRRRSLMGGGLIA
jgi:hypothetical protein